MRVLSLGFPLPGAPIDNFTFINAPSFFDYDAVVVDPRTISQLIEDIVERDVEHSTPAGERVVNASTGPAGVALAEILHSRADETVRLLDRGRIVVCLAVPEVIHQGIDGQETFGRYSWLPVDSLAALIRRGSGTQFASFDLDDPFGAMLAQTRTKLAYQVHFDVSDQDRTARIIATSEGGAAVALEFSVGAGRVVLLPPPARPLDSNGRYQMSEALQRAIGQALRLPSGSKAPAWLSEYDLPGLADRRTALASARSRFDETRAAVSAAEDALDELELYQRLLWDEGRTGLEEAVLRALTQLGFAIRNNQSARRIGLPGEGSPRVALIEVVGGEEAVDINAHALMRRHLEDSLAAGKVERGLLLVNGYRRRAPAERPKQYSDQLALAAEHHRYCLATTEQLFHAVRSALEGDDASVARFCDRLLITEGVLHDD